jgi:hypothetical protein
LAEAKPKRPKRAESSKVPVVRDSTFHRAVVDKALMLGVGEQIDIACLQMSTDISALHRQNGDIRLDTLNTLTEVVRLRLSWEAAVDLAMNILSNGIRSDTLDSVEILKTLAEVKAEGIDDAS